jgi:hypothetical protein
MKYLAPIRIFSPAVMLGLVLAAGMFASACDDTVDPFIEEERFFTIFGFLDTAADTQFVRVIPLRRRLVAEEADVLDASVTTTALEDGTPVVWRDSLIHFDDGSFGHVFFAPLHVFPGWTYRFEVRRSDGATAAAETTVPRAEHAFVGEPVEGPANLIQTVRWENVDAPPFRVEVWYRFADFPPSEPFREVVITYGEDRFGTLREDGWAVDVQLRKDRADVARRIGEPLVFLGVGMRLTMTDERWRPPGGVFDPELLIQPGVFSNVENGFGFLGSVNQYTTEWTLPEPTIEALGYSFPGKR